jgi:hypothetical protein
MVWLERDLELANAMRKQKEWRQEVKDTFETLHDEFLKTMALVEKEDFSKECGPEIKFGNVRSQALGYVLGLQDVNRLVGDQPVWQLGTSPSVAKTLNLENLTTHTEAMEIDGGKKADGESEKTKDDDALRDIPSDVKTTGDDKKSENGEKTDPPKKDDDKQDGEKSDGDSPKKDDDKQDGDKANAGGKIDFPKTDDAKEEGVAAAEAEATCALGVPLAGRPNAECWPMGSTGQPKNCAAIF